MIGRSWYGRATLMTIDGFSRSISADICLTSSALTCAVLIGRLICAAMRLYFSSVRLASTISENTSGTCAHLWVTTCPTPPAPTISTFGMLRLSGSVFVVGIAAQARGERLEHRLPFGHGHHAFADRMLGGLAKLLEEL